jgi:ABC-type uncharacterized transport system permease subunit
MILLHLAVATLYAIAAWSYWPSLPASDGRSGAASLALPRFALPLAVIGHVVVAWADIVQPDGLDLSLTHGLSVVAWLTVVLSLVSGLLRTLPAVGAILLPVAAVATLLPPLFPNPHHFAYAGNVLAAAHIGVAFIAYAMFILAALYALVLIGLERRLHRRLPDPGSAELPPLLTLERFLFRLIGVGFALLTLTLASGMLFTEEIFGQPLRFTHKTVLSVAAWLAFGALLWGRWRYGWRGRVALRWILAGTVFLLLAYLGYKFVLEVILGR